jgi:formate hydrogenlyase subunit 4
MHYQAMLNYVAGLVLAPLITGVIGRVKARFAGRTGPPVLQPYYDLIKLFKKGAVYSESTTWIFRASAPVSLAALLVGLAVVPFGASSAPVSFTGDFLVLVAMLGIMRFFIIIAALDTGSSFEGMGASREALFSALAEPAFLLGIAALAGKTGGLSLSAIFATGSMPSFEPLLVVAAFVIVFLCENGRIPIDDPATHLELTMIHEVMVLDHSGPDFGLMQYGASLKQWIFGAIIVDIVAPLRLSNRLLDSLGGVAGIIVLAIAVGALESTMARLRLLRVPQLITAAGALSTIAVILITR